MAANEFIPTSLRGVGNGWNYMFNKITEAIRAIMVNENTIKNRMIVLNLNPTITCSIK